MTMRHPRSFVSSATEYEHLVGLRVLTRRLALSSSNQNNEEDEEDQSEGTPSRCPRRNADCGARRCISGRGGGGARGHAPRKGSIGDIDSARGWSDVHLGDGELTIFENTGLHGHVVLKYCTSQEACILLTWGSSWSSWSVEFEVTTVVPRRISRTATKVDVFATETAYADCHDKGQTLAMRMITHQAIEDDNISTKKSEHMANHSVQCHICVTFIVASGLPGRGLRNGSRIVSPILVTVEVLELKYIRKIYITRLILKASSPYSTINGTVFGEGEHCN